MATQETKHFSPGLRLAVPFALAALAVLVAWAVREGLGPWLERRAEFLIFVLPVFVSALFLGRGPSILALFLSMGAGLTFIPSGGMAEIAVQVQIALFILVGIGIIWLARRRAEAADSAERLRERSEAQAALAGRRTLELHLLLEGAAHYAIFMVDAEGVIATWNKGAERIFGWPEELAVGQSGAILYPAEGAAERAAADLEQAREAGQYADEAWQLRRDRSEFLADVRITPVRDKAGKLLGYAKVIHDVTERRAAERAIETRERHLQSILATVPDAMVVIDDRGIMISFSAAAERLFGYSEAEVLGKNVSMLMPNPDRDRHDSYIERYLGTGVPHIIGIGRIVSGLRADGSTFPMKLSVGEALSDGQRLFTGFIQDLTERREFEAKLEEVKSELIHVSRLSAMGTMASTLAHELNQPLTAIATYGEAVAEMLEGTEPPDTGILREAFADMAAQSVRAGAIVRRLREFVGRGEVSKSVEDLPALINEASALALVGTRERGVSAIFSYDDQATPVFVDRVQIQQVVINLMRNAIEAMEGCPARRLTVETSLVDAATVQVSVADTGPGLAPEIRERLFEAFATTKSSGMGLGLSICRTIIEAHGGRIRAIEAEGGGTEFRFTLMKPPAVEA